MGRYSKDKRDVFYRRAKEAGYRARSAFKLLQLNAEFHFLDGHNLSRVVDLCAAPGSWSQVLVDTVRNTPERRLVAVDLQPMAPIDGVTCLQGDITQESTAQRIISACENKKCELVICDGAPDVTGLHDMDEYMQAQLLGAALRITTHVLAKGGTFVAKVFRGRNSPTLSAQLRHLFRRVSMAKPSSSRNSSVEAFCVCEGFVGEEPFLNLPLDGSIPIIPSDVGSMSKEEQQRYRYGSVLPFVACGDLSQWKNGDEGVVDWDADKSYPVASVTLSSSIGASSSTSPVATASSSTSAPAATPIAPPIHPPYETSKKLQQEKRQLQQKQQHH